MRRVTAAAPAARMPMARPMGRGAFLRGVGAAAVAGAASFSGVRPVRAVPGDPKPDMINIVGSYNDPTITVYPTGDPAKDLPNVRWAVDNVLKNGTVLLKAKNIGGAIREFYFGYPSIPPTIKITRPLTVRGEVDGAKTVIKGGYATFVVDTYDQSTGTLEGPVNFDTINSLLPKLAFLTYNACSRTTIKNVHILNGIVPSGVEVSSQQPNFYGMFFDPTRVGYPADKIGRIEIIECNFDFSNLVDNYSEIEDIVQDVAINTMNMEINMLVDRCNFKDVGSRCVNTIRTFGSLDITGCTMNLTRANYTPALNFRYVRTLHTGTTPTNGRNLQLNFSNNNISIVPRKYNDFEMEDLAIRLYGVSGTVANNIVYQNNKNNKNYGSVVALDNFCSNVNLYGNTFSGDTMYGINIRFNQIQGSHTFYDNDLSGLHAGFQVVVYAPDLNTKFLNNSFGPSTNWSVGCYGSGYTFENNVFSPPDYSEMPAIYCIGNNNTFNNNDFSSTDLKGFIVSSTGISRAGCVFLEYGTYGNVVNAVIGDLPPLEYPWYDPWLEFADVTCGSNTITLSQPNSTPPPAIIPYPLPDINKYDQLMDKISKYSDYLEHKAEMETQTVISEEL